MMATSNSFGLEPFADTLAAVNDCVEGRKALVAYCVNERLLELLRNFGETFLDHLGYASYTHADTVRALNSEELDRHIELLVLRQFVGGRRAGLVRADLVDFRVRLLLARLDELLKQAEEGELLI